MCQFFCVKDNPFFTKCFIFTFRTINIHSKSFHNYLHNKTELAGLYGFVDYLASL